VERAGLRTYLAYLLSDAERRVTADLAAVLRAEGVGVEQWRILQALSDGHGHSMTDLAEAVLMNHPTLTKLVDKMVSAALVYRRQDTVDRRRVAVYLSDRGTALLERLDRRVAEHQGALEAALGGAETAQLMQNLEELVDRLRGRARVIG
jgi:DNA-binding MarR family transcriptional regulator